jgi:hypothetical protein
MNIIKKGNVTYKYEFYWRDNKNDKTYDSGGKILMWPIASDKKWPDMDIFLKHLEFSQEIFIDKNKFKKVDKKYHKNCLICGKKNIVTGHFMVNGMMWDDGMVHYIKKHNIKPSEEFIDYVYRFTNNLHKLERVVGKIKPTKIIKYNKKMLKLDRNQILIMDALMWHGSKKFYKDCKNNNIYRYSEHYGLLDFNAEGLEKIVIFANTNKVDSIDDDIFLPRHNPDSYDYEYVFHTHPITGKKPGGRVFCGILYEFPSVSDVFHFVNHYNNGNTYGSIVVTAEGLYIIRKFVNNDKNIEFNEDDLYEELSKVIWDAQNLSIKKYGTEFDTNEFYAVIAQDTTYINMINKILNNHDLHIDFYPRTKDKNGGWYINTIYLSVNVME